MTGIQYIVDNKGKKTGVLINLHRHEELWEDFYDTLVAKSRSEEPRESFEEVKNKLRQKGKLRD